MYCYLSSVLGTKAAVKLEELASAPSLLKDVGKLSGDLQTWSLEAYHSLVNQFAPKMCAYSYEGMKCRCVKHALLVVPYFGTCKYEFI